MSFITVDMIKSLVTKDMIKELISDSVVRKIFDDQRVKTHIKLLVEKTVEELRKQDMSNALKSIDGMKSRLSGIMESDGETEMLDMMCDEIVSTLKINGAESSE